MDDGSGTQSDGGLGGTTPLEGGLDGDGSDGWDGCGSCGGPVSSGIRVTIPEAGFTPPDRSAGKQKCNGQNNPAACFFGSSLVLKDIRDGDNLLRNPSIVSYRKLSLAACSDMAQR